MHMTRLRADFTFKCNYMSTGGNRCCDNVTTLISGVSVACLLESINTLQYAKTTVHPQDVLVMCYTCSQHQGYVLLLTRQMLRLREKGIRVPTIEEA
jgi:hypothetical protein